jgi:hypothetical protein
LCVLLHETFDLGAFTVSGGVLLVSDQANGTIGFEWVLMAYHGNAIRALQHPDRRPEPRYVEWHGRRYSRARPGIGVGVVGFRQSEIDRRRPSISRLAGKILEAMACLEPV